MDAAARTLQDILQGDHRYVVPPYQRAYVWERERQWEPMWDDLVATAGRLARARTRTHGRGDDAVAADREVSPHFLGAIVLEQLPTGVGDIDRRSVVDGQQRITTIQLVIRGILDAIDQCGQRDNARSQCLHLQKMIRNDKDLFQDEQAYKLWPRRSERDAFIAAMDEHPPERDASRFAAARIYFAEAAGQWINAPDAPVDPYAEDECLGRIQLLSEVVRGLLKLVAINLEGTDDAQVIFEVLNARNTPLTAADLVKNLLFMRAEAEQPDSIEHLYERYWKPFDDDKWWSERVGTGHAARPRLDRFLGDFLIAQMGRLVNLGHLYAEARTWILDSGMSVEQVLQSLDTYAHAYRKVRLRDKEQLSGSEVRALGHIHDLQVVAADPLILWLLAHSPDELPHDARERAIAALEAYLVRRMATKWQTRGYPTAFAEALAQIKAGEGPVDQRLIETLKKGPRGYCWPSDEDLEESFVSTRAYGPGGMNQTRLRLLLGAVDRHLGASNTRSEPVTVDYANLTIEHILPRGWRRHWPIEAETEEERYAAEARRDRQLHRIGNLTLLTQVLNSDNSNAPWGIKREAIRRNSRLALNTELVETPDWSEQGIRERGTWLAHMVARIWPRPEDAVAGSEPASQDTDALDDEDIDRIHAGLLQHCGSTTGQETLIPRSALSEVLDGMGVLIPDITEDPVAGSAEQKLVADGRIELVDREWMRVLGTAPADTVVERE